ncbi:MAG: transposase, partial [Haloarculaceae archaeon]
MKREKRTGSGIWAANEQSEVSEFKSPTEHEIYGQITYSAVTDDGESFYCWTEENLTRHHGIRLLEALKELFGEELVVFLDRAGYFYARDLWEHVSGERETKTVGDSSVSCVRGDNLEVWYFPSKLPELNAVEGCWDQLQEWFKYRLIENQGE